MRSLQWFPLTFIFIIFCLYRCLLYVPRRQLLARLGVHDSFYGKLICCHASGYVGLKTESKGRVGFSQHVQLKSLKAQRSSSNQSLSRLRPFPSTPQVRIFSPSEPSNVPLNNRILLVKRKKSPFYFRYLAWSEQFRISHVPRSTNPSSI